MIQRLARHEIDIKRWEECIRSSTNGMINILPWYLDVVIPNWNALVYKDYEAVMVLPLKSKAGLPFLYNPNFVRQLGVFSKKEVSSSITQLFLTVAKKKLPYFSFFLSQQESSLQSKERVFQQMYLNEELQWNENTKRNIKKAQKAFLQVVDEVSAEEVFDIYRENRGAVLQHNERDLQVMLQLMQEGLLRKQGKAYGIRNDKGELITAAYFFYFEQTVYYFIGSVNEEGKKKGAMHFLFHEVILQSVEQYQVFDFGGSTISSVAQFYKGLGGNDVTYFHYEGGWIKPILSSLKIV